MQKMTGVGRLRGRSLSITDAQAVWTVSLMPVVSGIALLEHVR